MNKVKRPEIHWQLMRTTTRRACNESEEAGSRFSKC